MWLLLNYIQLCMPKNVKNYDKRIVFLTYNLLIESMHKFPDEEFRTKEVDV